MATLGLGAENLSRIEAAFRFLGDYGFALVQSSETPACAWFRAQDRGLIVSFDPLRDVYVEIAFEHESFPQGTRALSELLSLVAPERAVSASVSGGAALAEELAGKAADVVRYCSAFLHGDVTAFAQAFRETLLVAEVRTLALAAFYRNDLAGATALYGALRDYWTQADREHYESASKGRGAKGIWRQRP